MNCKKCDNELKEGDRFCNNCGEPTTKMENTITQDIKNNVQEFINYIVSVIKKPVVKKEKLKENLPKNKTLVYLPIIMLINSIILTFQFKTLQNSFLRMGRGAGNIMFGVRDVLGSVYGFRIIDIILNSFMLTIIFFLVLGVITMLVYNVILKKDIDFIDTLRMATHTMIILTLSNFIIWGLSMVSIGLLIIGLVFTIMLFTVMIIAQLFTYIGFGAKTIYTIPIVYITSLYLSLGLSVILI